MDKEISKFGYSKKLEKSQSKVAMAEEIGCGNDIVLSKLPEKMNWDKNQSETIALDGWVSGKAVLRIAYTNKKENSMHFPKPNLEKFQKLLKWKPRISHKKLFHIFDLKGGNIVWPIQYDRPPISSMTD